MKRNNPPHFFEEIIVGLENEDNKDFIEKLEKEGNIVKIYTDKEKNIENYVVIRKLYKSFVNDILQNIVEKNIKSGDIFDILGVIFYKVYRYGNIYYIGTTGEIEIIEYLKNKQKLDEQKLNDFMKEYKQDKELEIQKEAKRNVKENILSYN